LLPGKNAQILKVFAAISQSELVGTTMRAAIDTHVDSRFFQVFDAANIMGIALTPEDHQRMGQM